MARTSLETQLSGRGRVHHCAECELLVLVVFPHSPLPSSTSSVFEKLKGASDSPPSCEHEGGVFFVLIKRF